MFWFLFVIQMLSGFVAQSSSIRSTPEGRVALDRLSSIGALLLKWRATANCWSELAGLQRMFGWAAVIFGAIAVISTNIFDSSTTIFLPIVFLLLWGSMQFRANFWEAIGKMQLITLLYMAMPWIVLLMQSSGSPYVGGADLSDLASPISAFLPSGASDLMTAFILSLFGLFVGLSSTIGTVLLFSIVPLSLLLLIVTSSLVCRKLVSIPTNYIHRISKNYFYFIGPLLLAMESQGII